MGKGFSLSVDVTTVALFVGGGFAAQAANGFLKNISYISDKTDEAEQKHTTAMVEGGKAAIGLGVAYMVKNPMVKAVGLGFAVVSAINAVSALVPNVAGGLYGIGDADENWSGYVTGMSDRQGTAYAQGVGGLPQVGV